MELGKENQIYIFLKILSSRTTIYWGASRAPHHRGPPPLRLPSAGMKVEMAFHPGHLQWLLSPQWHHWPSVNTVDIEDSLLCWLLIICANIAEHKPLLSLSVLLSFRLRSSQFSRWHFLLLSVTLLICSSDPSKVVNIARRKWSRAAWNPKGIISLLFIETIVDVYEIWQDLSQT